MARRYAVEYANSLMVSGASFTQALMVTETNVPAGVESTETFVDDYTLTGGAPGPNGRYHTKKGGDPGRAHTNF